MKYLTTKEAAEKLGLTTTQAVTLIAGDGGFPGAIQPWGEGRGWLIPESDVAKRLAKKAAGKLHKGGRPRKSNGEKGLKKAANSSPK